MDGDQELPYLGLISLFRANFGIKKIFSHQHYCLLDPMVENRVKCNTSSNLKERSVFGT